MVEILAKGIKRAFINALHMFKKVYESMSIMRDTEDIERDPNKICRDEKYNVFSP